MSEKKIDNGILFPKGTKSLCLIGSDFGEKGTLIKGKEYYHPEDNCITDENGKDLFIPTAMIHHFKNLGEATEIPELRTKQGVSIDDHLNTIKLLKSHFEKENAMKTQQLPPELVEKMRKDIYTDVPSKTTCNVLANKCANIAVDYADEQKDNLLTNYIQAMGEAYRFKQQHDKLLKSLKINIDRIQNRLEDLKSQRSLYSEDHELHHRYDAMCACLKKELSETKQLLKKHEDGKE